MRRRQTGVSEQGEGQRVQERKAQGAPKSPAFALFLTHTFPILFPTFKHDPHDSVALFRCQPC